MLRTRLSDALKTAMKERDAARVSTLRLVLAALKDRDIAARTEASREGVGEAEILRLLQSMVKQRRESIDLYRQGGREDLVAREAAEVAVIEEFLPRQMGEAAIEAAVKGAIAEVGAAGIKDMGRVVALLKSRHAGEMDVSQAAALAKRLLGT